MKLRYEESVECVAWALSSVLISDFLCGERDCLFLGVLSSNGASAQGGAMKKMNCAKNMLYSSSSCSAHYFRIVVSVSNNFGTAMYLELQ